MYILELLFTSLDVNSISKIKPDFFTLNPIILCLLKFIIQKINSLYKRPSCKPVEIVPNNEDYFNYFPAFRKNYMIPHYDHSELDSQERCTKLYPKHNNLGTRTLSYSVQTQDLLWFSDNETKKIYNFSLQNTNNIISTSIHSI